MRTYETDTTGRDFLAGVADEHRRIGALVAREYARARDRFEKAELRESPHAYALAAADLAVSHAMERIAADAGIDLELMPPAEGE